MIMTQLDQQILKERVCYFMDLLTDHIPSNICKFVESEYFGYDMLIFLVLFYVIATPLTFLSLDMDSLFLRIKISALIVTMILILAFLIVTLLK